VADAQGKVEDLTKENADVAAEVSIRFAASLSTHGDILERLGDGSEDEDTQEYSGRLAYYAKSNVEDRAREESEDEDKSTGGESMSVEFTLKATTSEEAELDATRISGATIPLVSTEVSSTHAATASPISTVSTTSTTSAEEVEEEHIRSIEEEVRYEVLLKASKKYNRDFLKELWRSQDGKDEDEDGEGRGEVRGWRGNRDSRD
jgi:hypothetical protein